MKKYSRLLSIALMTALIMTSSLFAVFAVGETPGTDPAPTPSEQVAPPSAPAAVLADTQGKNVVVSWPAVTEATEYRLTVVNGTKTLIDSSVGNITSYVVGGIDAAEDTTFTVKAISNGVESTPASLVWNGVVPVKYQYTVKAACSLKSHAGKRRTLRLKKGDVVEATNFAAGQYIFKVNGSTYYMNKTRARNPKVVYTKKFNYDPEQIELFVNRWGFKSKTKRMVFVSVYTQHLYVLSGKKGNWTAANGKGWEVSTGKASTPTPTGRFTGSLKVHKKLKNRHGLPYWSCFSSFNAFHGKKSSWKLGSPKSGGCVRNEVKNAKWIFNNVPLKSRAVLY